MIQHHEVFLKFYTTRVMFFFFSTFFLAVFLFQTKNTRRISENTRLMSTLFVSVGKIMNARISLWKISFHVPLNDETEDATEKSLPPKGYMLSHCSKLK